MNQRLHRWFLFPVLLGLLISLVGFCGPARAGERNDSNGYAASLADADVLIHIPSLRQYGDYTCGTTCVQMLMNWLRPYEADLNLAQYEELLHTSAKSGTSPGQILAYLEESGVAFSAVQPLSLEGLRQMLDAGHPVLMPLQAWSSAPDGSYNLDTPAEAETYLAEGHWVICVGYCRNADRPYFLFNDPACVGHVLLYENELDQRWIDMDGSGVIYDHFGIAILQETRYDAMGLYHMD